jgi:hypothetical protein
VDVFPALGVNIVNLADCHDDTDPSDPGPKRFAEHKVSATVAAQKYT